jgi:hypothetical protein
MGMAYGLDLAPTEVMMVDQTYRTPPFCLVKTNYIRIQYFDLQQ